ncbi:SLC26A/SulP transporter family protein [Candidatus Dependentiae bacterium]|nr:SLC26A/SulP transporter family protein [Candidatus Dependentiae bacterium]
MITFKNFKNDLNGGIVAGIIALPLAIAFGVSSFSSLGPDYVSTGAVAGLYGAIFTGLFAALFGGTPSQVTGPTGPMAVVSTAAIVTLMQNPSLQAAFPTTAEKIPVILFLFGFTVILGGMTEIFLGIVHAGKIVKYIPYSVIAGFMNGIAVIIFFGQIKPFFGFSSGTSWNDLFTKFGSVNLYIAIIGIATILGILYIPKILKKIPTSLSGMFVGIIVYFIIGKILYSEFLNPINPYIIGNIPAKIPTPEFIFSLKKFIGYINIDMFKILIGPALTLGILGAIDTLLTSVVADVKTKTRHNSDKELFGQGIGNIMAGIFGGIAGAGATVRTLVNIDAGGKTNLSGIIHGLLLLLIVLVFGRWAKWIPMTVLSGILFITAIKMIDIWSVSLIKKKSARLDVIVMIVVTIVTAVIDLMVAVGIGLGIASIIFIKNQAKQPVIKRILSAKTFRSKKIRSTEENEILEKFGEDIVLIEMQGSLFFGTTDSFSVFIEKHIKKVKYIIFDLKNVLSIDLTGAQLFLDLMQKLKESGIIICFSSMKKFNDQEREEMITFLNEIGIIKEITNERIFFNNDFALEYCEDSLLREHNIDMSRNRSYNIEDMDLLNGLYKNEIEIIEKYCKKNKYNRNDIIFKQGDPGNEMYFIGLGEVSIVHKLSEDAVKRIVTYSVGSHFGEMAILENKPRSATVIATSETELYILSKTDFFNIMKENAKLAYKVLTNLNLIFSERLRNTSRELNMLSEN